MPNIHLEHTDNIHTKDIMGLFISLQDILIELADVKAKNCKSRAIHFNNYHIGSCDINEGFVHLEINILEGRSDEIKTKIGRESLKVLKSYFRDNAGGYSIQYSLEIREMKCSDYFTSNNT